MMKINIATAGGLIEIEAKEIKFIKSDLRFFIDKREVVDFEDDNYFEYHITEYSTGLRLGRDLSVMAMIKRLQRILTDYDSDAIVKLGKIELDKFNIKFPVNA